MKAFLSHSSSNKEFVSAVANELGRQFCLLDEKAFATGDEFKLSIEKYLDESSVFVLFVSRKALESIWVDFEITEAWYRILNNKLSQSLVYLLDTSVSHEDLPEWLRRTKVSRINSPKAVAREIRYHIDEIIRQKQHPFFIGRASDIENIQKALTPYDGKEPPHFLIVNGLSGIGRRTCIKHSVRDVLALQRVLEIKIQEGDSIHDIAIKIADKIEPYSTEDGFNRIVESILTSGRDEVLKRILNDIKIIVSNRELPIFVDAGGLLDPDGRFNENIKQIIRHIAPNDDAYVFFVTNRKPYQDEPTVPHVSINPLKPDAIKSLISAIAGTKVKLSSAIITELAEYVKGFPPSAYFAVELAKEYGSELILKDKGRLVDFRSLTFIRYLNKLILNKTQKDILILLATYSPIPLIVLGEVLELDALALSNSLTSLIDYSLVITDENGYYSLSDPVTDAVISVLGFPNDEHHTSTTRYLSKFLSENDEDTARLELSRVLFRAASLANDRTASEGAFHLANDLIRLTEETYHRRDYKTSIKYGKLAISERPDNLSTRDYFIKALIQEERWEDAKEEIDKIRSIAPLREIYYLEGFLNRKRGNVSEATKLYLQAIDAGRKGVAVNRELATCYFNNGDYGKALLYVEKALTIRPDNTQVVDLWIQIATKQKDEAKARDGLTRLEFIDKPAFYLHRLSTVEQEFGNLDEARNASLKAIGLEARPTFEMIAQLIYCEIKTGHLDAAESLLARLDKEFHGIRQDIRYALECRLYINRKLFNRAIGCSEKIRDKKTPYFYTIRREAITGELAFASLDDKQRIAYEEELKEINKRLESVGESNIEPLL